MKPIRPDEVQRKRDLDTPDAVFEVFNALIAESWNGSSATVRQKDASVRIAEALGISYGDVFLNNLLDVEESYRKAGWSVEYDKPGYNESYEASFTFKKKSR